jgi:hypothetical protein
MASLTSLLAAGIDPLALRLGRIGDPLTATATTLSFTIGDMLQTLTGSFQLDGAGQPVGGTVTGWSQSEAGSLLPLPLVQIDGFAVSLGTYLTAAAGQPDLFFRAALAGNDTFRGGGGPDTLHGYAGDDLLIGSAGNDILYGDEGNDTLQGGLGNDTLWGGAGTDKAAYDGARGDYRIQVTNGAVTVTGTGNSAMLDGADILLNIELIEFGDRTVYMLNGDQATVARLYSAAFARAPDAGGLFVQLEQGLGNGLSTLQLANNFLNSAEFIARYGAAPTNAQYATALYSNVLGRAPDTDGLANQLAALDGGLSRAQILLNFADSFENRTKVAGDWLFS